MQCEWEVNKPTISFTKECDEPLVAPPFSSILYDPSMPPYYRDTAVNYTCDPGYVIISGDVIRTCTVSGNSNNAHWSGSEPVCGGIGRAYKMKTNMTFVYTWNTIEYLTCTKGEFHSSVDIFLA